MSKRRPIVMEDVSDDEADSEPAARLQSATYRQLWTSASGGSAEAVAYDMQMGKMPSPSFLFCINQIRSGCLLTFGIFRVCVEHSSEPGGTRRWCKHRPCWFGPASAPANGWHIVAAGGTRIGFWSL
jgi:hypothetical protein